MRKALFLILALLAVVAAISVPIPMAEAAGGGFTTCSYKCDCAGRAWKCCPAGSTSCFPTSEFACPQIYTC